MTYDSATDKWINEDPAGGASLINAITALVQLDFGMLNIPNNGYWLWRTMTPMDFGSFTTGNQYLIDLGLTSVTENTVTSTTNVETFVWQNDPA